MFSDWVFMLEIITKYLNKRHFVTTSSRSYAVNIFVNTVGIQKRAKEELLLPDRVEDEAR
jgi:hypothetical protein